MGTGMLELCNTDPQSLAESAGQSRGAPAPNEGKAMAIPPQASVNNQLLDLLPEVDYNQVRPDLDYVKVARGALIATAGAPIDMFIISRPGLAPWSPRRLRVTKRRRVSSGVKVTFRLLLRWV